MLSYEVVRDGPKPSIDIIEKFGHFDSLVELVAGLR